jgi:hypothetical protein
MRSLRFGDTPILLSGRAIQEARIEVSFVVASWNPFEPRCGVFILGASGKTFQPIPAYFSAAASIAFGLELRVVDSHVLDKIILHSSSVVDRAVLFETARLFQGNPEEFLC